MRRELSSAADPAGPRPASMADRRCVSASAQVPPMANARKAKPNASSAASAAPAQSKSSESNSKRISSRTVLRCQRRWMQSSSAKSAAARTMSTCPANTCAAKTSSAPPSRSVHAHCTRPWNRAPASDAPTTATGTSATIATPISPETAQAANAENQRGRKLDGPFQSVSTEHAVVEDHADALAALLLAVHGDQAAGAGGRLPMDAPGVLPRPVVAERMHFEPEADAVLGLFTR